MEQIQFFIETDLKTDFKLITFMQHKDMSSVLRELIADYVQKHKNS